jgi:diguanylate cyclase (GGDEF)-like protein/PAS domain S-box-containing protein
MQLASLFSNNCRNILDNLPCGVYMTDPDRQIIFWNKAAARITGFSPSEVIGFHCYDNILMHVDEDGANLCTDLCPLAKTINDGTSREGNVFLHHKDGHRTSVKINTIVLKAPDGSITGCAEIFTDASQFNATDIRIKELEKIAFFDRLSNLPNREYMESELDLNFHEFRRMGQRFGVLFLDIDHFKNFNDRFSHEAGDRIIRTVANTLRASSRPFDVFGRWGGEEFVGIIKDVDPEKLVKIGNRYRKLIEQSSITLGDTRVGITVSIGATVVRKKDVKKTIINRADRLMYECKEKGRNCLASDSGE